MFWHLHPSSSTEYHLGKYFLEEVESNLYKRIHPLQQNIYSSTILGERILQIVTRSFFLGDIKIDSWCVVGAAWSGVAYIIY
jgi:hypothetical protein